LVDDDRTFCEVLGRALQRRGFAVTLAHDAEQGALAARECAPEYAVVDLKMPGPSGLSLITALKQANAGVRILVLTGYASVTTAVEAIKLGATHYLAKPSDADEIVAALGRRQGDAAAPVSDSPLSLRRLEWEHLQKVLGENQGNVSATAKLLGMHRSVLQRKLKKPPRTV
jgi:two-component system response regulator RegA